MCHSATNVWKADVGRIIDPYWGRSQTLLYHLWAGFGEDLLTKHLVKVHAYQAKAKIYLIFVVFFSLICFMFFDLFPFARAFACCEYALKIRFNSATRYRMQVFYQNLETGHDHRATCSEFGDTSNKWMHTSMNSNRIKMVAIAAVCLTWKPTICHRNDLVSVVPHTCIADTWKNPKSKKKKTKEVSQWHIRSESEESIAHRWGSTHAIGPPWLWNPGQRVTRSLKQAYQWLHKKDWCVPKYF